MGLSCRVWVPLFVLARRPEGSHGPVRRHGVQVESASGLPCIHVCPAPLPRPDAARRLDEAWLPAAAFGDRLAVSGGTTDRTAAVRGSDPSLELAYGEFPLDSFDALVDAALRHRHPPASSSSSTTTKTTTAAEDGEFHDSYPQTESIRFVDLGSGAGRLCLYAAMTRPGWQVHGIEVVPSLHEVALGALKRGVAAGVFSAAHRDDGDPHGARAGPTPATLQFSLGPAAAFAEVLAAADLVFCYSTVWSHAGFSPQTRSMVLSPAWGDLLGRCRPGALVVTTDRACDPARGWTLLEAWEVANPEVAGSVGYLQRLDSAIRGDDVVCRYHG